MRGDREAGAPGESFGSPRLAIGVISVANAAHQERRCFQRATLAAFTRGKRSSHGWLRLAGGGAVTLRYVMSGRGDGETSALVADEHRVHGDVIVTEIPDSEYSCAPKIFFALRNLVSIPGAQFVAIGDDDTFVHPGRIATDLRWWASQPGDFLYASLSWCSGWSDRSLQHHGYGHASELPRLVAEWRAAAWHGDGGIGPFAVPMGALVTFSRDLAAAVATAPHTLALERRLRARWSNASYPRPRRRGKCLPFTDGAMGFALARLGRAVTVLDFTSTERFGWFVSVRGGGRTRTCPEPPTGRPARTAARPRPLPPRPTADAPRVCSPAAPALSGPNHGVRQPPCTMYVTAM